MRLARPAGGSGQDPTNSVKHPPLNGATDSIHADWVGVDKVGLTLPITGETPLWRSQTVKGGKRARLKTEDGVPIEMGQYYTPEGQRAWIEFNPARIHDPGGWRAAPLQEVLPCTGVALGLARTVLLWDIDAEVMTLNRLDVVRDFEGVANPSLYLERLSPIARTHATKNELFRNTSTNLAETIEVGSKDGGYVKLYDKHSETARAEIGGRAPKGALRFEVHARDWCARYGQMTLLGDFDSKNCVRLLMNRWTWSQMGTEFHSESKYIAVLQEHFSGTESRNLMGHLLVIANGGTSNVSHSTLSKWRKKLALLGLPLSPSVIRSDVPHISRLDFATGREVVTG